MFGPHAGVRGAHEGGDEIGEPLGVGVSVVVEVGDDLPGGRLQPRVAGVGKTAVLRLDEPAIVPPRDGGRVVGGPVVHDNDFIVGVLEPSEPLEAVADGGRPIIGAHHDRDARPRHARREWRLRERFVDSFQRGLRRPVGARQAELPVLDVVPVPVPLVGPSEHEHAGAAGGERRPHLPVERSRLGALAVAQAVEAQLAHEERPVARDVLEAREVGLEPVLRLEVHVEADEVEKRQPQVFGGRVVDVGDKPVGVFFLDHPVHPLEVALDRATADVARHRRGYLVAEGVAQQRRMPCDGAHLAANQRLHVRTARRPVQDVADVLLGAEPDHDSEPVSQRDVEQRAGWRRVRNPNGVDPVRRHQREVPLHQREVVVFVPVGVGSERAVGDAVDVELGVAEEEELAAHRRPGDGNRDGGEPRRGAICRECRRRADRHRAAGTVASARAEILQQRNPSQVEPPSRAASVAISAGRMSGYEQLEVSNPYAGLRQRCGGTARTAQVLVG